MSWRTTICVGLLLTWGGGCQKETPAPVPPAATPTGVTAPNANAAHYGAHGVSAVPTAPAPTPTTAPDPQGAAEPAEHACACGASCHCGHCSGAIPGCHCKAEKAQQK